MNAVDFIRTSDGDVEHERRERYILSILHAKITSPDYRRARSQFKAMILLSFMQENRVDFDKIHNEGWGDDA